ncbi:MAG TPA: hypothetical protein VNX02_11490 [Steroidobacteraceae bacterium]|nr:hypothetical protein [Steroidobacteraceae bacterium]
MALLTSACCQGAPPALAGTPAGAAGVAQAAAAPQANAETPDAGTPPAAPAADPSVKDSKEKGNAPQAAPAKDEQQKKDQKTGDKGNASEKKDGSDTPIGIQWFNAVFGKLTTWAFVALAFLFLFSDKLRTLFDRVTDAIGERGVTLEVAKVKIQVSEPAQRDLYEDRGARFTVSPLDLDGDGSEDLEDTLVVTAQLTFQVSDDAACWWLEHHPEHAHLLEKTKEAFVLLTDKFGTATRLTDVMQELVAFSRALEKVRFIDATRLKNLLEEKPGIRDELIALARSTQTDDDRVAVHAGGAAYVHSSEWSLARDLLEPIAWVDQQPGYLPAADTWLAALYLDGVEKALGQGSTTQNAFLNSVLGIADNVVLKAETILGQMDSLGKASPYAGNMEYYRREVNKVLGTVASFRADYSQSLTERQRHLRRALQALLVCTATVGGEKPSPLDQNNLADTYRQLGRFDKDQYGKAHEEIRKALAKKPLDPTFLSTEALIYIDEWKRDRAWEVLRTVAPEKMAGADRQDAVQYLDNQILAAKVVSGTDRPRVVRLHLAADTLESAMRFLDSKAAQLDSAEHQRLAAELNELLGAAYLGLPGYERRSVECYECLARRWGSLSTTAEVRWRRRLGGVRAYTRLARVSRADFDYSTACSQRKLGRKVIKDNLGELDVALGVGNGQLGTLSLWQARVLLDTAMALQGLAEEAFHGGEFGETKDLLAQKDKLIGELRDFREHDSIGTKVRLAGALTGLLRGWLAFQCDAGTYEPAVLTEIESNLLSARGQDARLNCQVDLALGEVFLAAALAGKAADALSNYRKAIGALERAVAPEAPAPLRADATRALVDAYVKQPAVQRRAKEPKQA